MGKDICSYCERFTLKPHVIRIGKSTSVICPRCIKRNDERYARLTNGAVA